MRKLNLQQPPVLRVFTLLQGKYIETKSVPASFDQTQFAAVIEEMEYESDYHKCFGTNTDIDVLFSKYDLLIGLTGAIVRFGKKIVAYCSSRSEVRELISSYKTLQMQNDLEDISFLN